MKPTRNVLAILALASFAFAFAEEPGAGAKPHEATACASKGTTKSKGKMIPTEVKPPAPCNCCEKSAEKMDSPKDREAEPLYKDYMS